MKILIEGTPDEIAEFLMFSEKQSKSSEPTRIETAINFDGTSKEYIFAEENKKTIGGENDEKNQGIRKRT